MLPRDGVSKLQVAVTDLAGVYLDALKDVQNEVERMHQANELGTGTNSLTELTSLLADRVIGLHEVIDQQAATLEASYRSEAQQLRALQDLDAQHTAVTTELRSQVEAAEVLQDDVRRRLDSLIDGIQELNASHRDVPNGGDPVMSSSI